jgi:hypothetical protein
MNTRRGGGQPDLEAQREALSQFPVSMVTGIGLVVVP